MVVVRCCGGGCGEVRRVMCLSWSCLGSCVVPRPCLLHFVTAIFFKPGGDLRLNRVPSAHAGGQVGRGITTYIPYIYIYIYIYS